MEQPAFFGCSFEELILKVGASFKAGHYRSPQNYFSRALQEHRSLTKNNPSYFLQQLIKNTTRSIVRGMGPTPFKDSFEIELLCRICVYNFPTGQAIWLDDPAAKIDATLVCCWWLLRGIEAAAGSRYADLHVHRLVPCNVSSSVSARDARAGPSGCWRSKVGDGLANLMRFMAVSRNACRCSEMMDDCVMGLISPGCTVSMSSTGMVAGAGVGMLAGMLGTVVPAVSQRILKATWIGE